MSADICFTALPTTLWLGGSEQGLFTQHQNATAAKFPIYNVVSPSLRAHWHEAGACNSSRRAVCKWPAFHFWPRHVMQNMFDQAKAYLATRERRGWYHNVATLSSGKETGMQCCHRKKKLELVFAAHKLGSVFR